MQPREMNKKLLSLICAFACLVSGGAMAAVTVKKAASVATQKSDTSTTASLVPTVLGLVGNVKQLSSQQKALTTECVPSSAEITFVNNIMKEWARVGEMNVNDVQTALKRKPCNVATGGYAAAITRSAGTEFASICYDYFAGDGNDDQVWAGFPMAAVATYCADGSLSCKNKETVSDIYEIFNLIDFSEADYTKTEATMAARLISKIENCSSARLSAKKKALWGEFLTNTVSGIGQKTNTTSIMDVAGSVAGGGGGLSSLGTIVSQFADR